MTDPSARTSRGRTTAATRREVEQAAAARAAEESLLQEQARAARDVDGGDEYYPENEMESQLADAGQAEPDELPMLYPGDIMVCKLSSSFDVAGKEQWVTFGLQSRLRPGESENDLFSRITSGVLLGLEDITDATEEQLWADRARRVEAERNRPIQVRRPRN